jgi:hypothetical protein
MFVHPKWTFYIQNIHKLPVVRVLINLGTLGVKQQLSYPLSSIHHIIARANLQSSWLCNILLCH